MSIFPTLRYYKNVGVQSVIIFLLNVHFKFYFYLSKADYCFLKIAGDRANDRLQKEGSGEAPRNGGRPMSFFCFHVRVSTQVGMAVRGHYLPCSITVCLALLKVLTILELG